MRWIACRLAGILIYQGGHCCNLFYHHVLRTVRIYNSDTTWELRMVGWWIVACLRCDLAQIVMSFYVIWRHFWDIFWPGYEDFYSIVITLGGVFLPHMEITWSVLKAKIFALGEWNSCRGLTLVANSGVSTSGCKTFVSTFGHPEYSVIC